MTTTATIDHNDWITTTVKMLVDHPDEARINFVESTQCTIAEITLHPSDVGQLIGGDGANIRSLRHLLNCYGRVIRRTFKLHLNNGPKHNGPKRRRSNRAQNGIEEETNP